jgi:hypothetical protein
MRWTVVELHLTVGTKSQLEKEINGEAHDRDRHVPRCRSDGHTMIRMVNRITTSAVLALALAWSAPCVHAQSTAVSSVAPPSARVSPRDKWNHLLGGNWQPDKRWSLTAEVGGLADRVQFIGSVMWRF